MINIWHRLKQLFFRIFEDMKTGKQKVVKSDKKRSLSKHWFLLFHYLRRTGFFREIGIGFLQFIGILVFAGAVLLVIDSYVVSVPEIFEYIITHVPVYVVFIIFTLNESFLALIPPDFFVVWSEELQYPWLILTIMGILSYIGGIISFQIGISIRKIPFINRWIKRRFERHVKNIKRWGGWIIVAGAVTPLPFSLLVIITGMLGYPFKRYLIFGLTRLPRFALYALVIYNVVNL